MELPGCVPRQLLPSPAGLRVFGNQRQMSRWNRCCNHAATVLEPSDGGQDDVRQWLAAFSFLSDGEGFAYSRTLRRGAMLDRAGGLILETCAVLLAHGTL